MQNGTDAVLPLYLVMEPAQTLQTVLVVEDEVLIRMCTAAALEDAGFRVLEAKDCAEALGVLQTYPEISIIVTDVHMPGGMDGLGLVAWVQRENPVIRSLVVSGRACAAEAFGAGAKAFLAKPFQMDGIVRAVTAMAA